MIPGDMLTDAQRRCIPDVSFELIPIRNLVSNQEYQRPLSENHIRKALEEFDVYQINPVKVSRRDGINYVFDGQHTIEIIASESNSCSITLMNFRRWMIHMTVGMTFTQMRMANKYGDVWIARLTH